LIEFIGVFSFGAMAPDAQFALNTQSGDSDKAALGWLCKFG
jgi:hypothetical protein